jgi:outer membrane receptor protein involved in Fe transport
MKKLLLAAFILVVALQAQAQFPVAAPGGKGSAGAMNIGHVYGKIIDSAGKPVADASVVLLQNKYDSASKKRKDVLLKAMNATSIGEFSFEDLPMFGPLKLKITAVGFKPYEQAVTFQMNMGAMAQKPAAGGANANPMAAIGAMLSGVDKDLGNIKLKEDAVQLANVTVTSSAPTLKMDIDKKTFNVEKNIVTAGGTGIDVMRNVPSVQVDIDGNVKLRNATPQIYIDGRPTTLTLDQIPADAIQSVEVITNPSAKYDASGGNAGILNIVLKKNKKTGYNGNVMAGVDSRGGYNGGGNFNVRQGKFNVTAVTMVNARYTKTTGNIQRETFEPLTDINQGEVDNQKGQFIFGRLGADYYITNRTTLSLAGIKVHGQFTPTSTLNTDSLDQTGKMYNYNIRNTNGGRTFNATGLQGGMVHNFKKDGEQLTADGNFFSGKNSSNSIYTTNYYNAAGGSAGLPLTQEQLASGNNSFLTLQTDFVNPITKQTKIEAGLRAQIRHTVNNTDTYTQDQTGVFEKNPQATNDYKSKDAVYAAYGTFTSAIKNFGYQVGLRAESSDYSGTITNTNQNFSHTYPLSLFPSVFLSQKLKHDQELQLNFSRRINRPNFFQLIPYTDSTDLNNITRGNPDLVPEFTYSLEASYSKSFKGGNSLLFSVYYKHTENLITRYLDSVYNSTGKLYLINTYINAQSSYSYGAELTSINRVSRWWDLTSNINIYNSQINTSNVPGATEQSALLSWFGKINNNFKLPANFSIQLSGDYQSKTNLPVSNGGQQFGPPQSAQSSSQGYIKPFWGVDIAIKKTFLKNQAASLSVAINDIFRTRFNEAISNQPGIFYQDYYRLNNPQLVRINFAYRFGKLDVSLFKRTNTKSTGTQDAMQGAQ